MKLGEIGVRVNRGGREEGETEKYTNARSSEGETHNCQSGREATQTVQNIIQGHRTSCPINIIQSKLQILFRFLCSYGFKIERTRFLGLPIQIRSRIEFDVNP
jgi:hypothetical protein